MPKKISSHHAYHDEVIQPLLPGELTHLQTKNEISTTLFEQYHARYSEHTLRRQADDLLLLREFLSGINIKTRDLLAEPAAWRVITWSLVEDFVKWQLSKGYAIPSINIRLSTIKTYARLAVQAGTLPPQEYSLIRSMQGYSYREGRNIDQKREKIRIGYKKAEPIKLTLEQAATLKKQPATPQGRRDALMMCLLLDHGIKVGELSALRMSDFDIRGESIRIKYRDQWQTLSPNSFEAFQACRTANELMPGDRLLRRSKKTEELGKAGMSERGITGRVCTLGESIGIQGLSSHDCRHYWINSALQNRADPFSLENSSKI